MPPGAKYDHHLFFFFPRHNFGATCRLAFLPPPPPLSSRPADPQNFSRLARLTPPQCPRGGDQPRMAAPDRAVPHRAPLAFLHRRPPVPPLAAPRRRAVPPHPTPSRRLRIPPPRRPLRISFVPTFRGSGPRTPAPPPRPGPGQARGRRERGRRPLPRAVKCGRGGGRGEAAGKVRPGSGGCRGKGSLRDGAGTRSPRSGRSPQRAFSSR